MSGNGTDTSKYLMYMHAGSANHGCEAIVRGLCTILGADVTLLSNRPGEDEAAGLGEIVKLKPVRRYEDSLVLRTAFYACRKLAGREDLQMGYAYRAAKPYNGYDMALSIGGDNYCYQDALVNLRGANRTFARHGLPTALVGCSVDAEILSDPRMVRDLSAYRCIIARESMTFESLKGALPEEMSEHIYLAPDPAFALEPAPCALPDGFKDGHTVGINVSPMVLGYEDPAHPGIAFRNYENLIRHIIDSTSDNILLIPHVTIPSSDDRETLRSLYDLFSDTGRIILLGDRPARELKYIISRLRLLVTARTHASIAAYSTCVPTLVVGYSVKATGISRDLFGTDEGYVWPVRSMTDPDDLVRAYDRLEEHADEQKSILQDRIPDIKDEAGRIKTILEDEAKTGPGDGGEPYESE